MLHAPGAGIRVRGLPRNHVWSDPPREGNDLAFEEESTWYQGEETLPPVSIFEAHEIAVVGTLRPNDFPYYVSATDFHDETGLGRNLGIMRFLEMGVAGKNITRIWILWHGSSVPSRTEITLPGPHAADHQQVPRDYLSDRFLHPCHQEECLTAPDPYLA